MSNDYALFMIIIPNDFNKEISTSPKTTNSIKQEASTLSIDTISALIAPASIPCSLPSPITLLTEKTNAQLQQASTKSLCAALTHYLMEKNLTEAAWMISDDKKLYQVTFHVEFGFVSDRILQDLLKLGIGRRIDTKIFVLPTIIILEGQISEKKGSISTSSLTDDINTITNNELLPTNVETNMNGTSTDDLTLSRKIRKRINESNFKKSVRARLMVHQVVASIRASTALSFDFVLLICLASMLAAFGLLENSTVIIVASMLVSPMMNPILGIVFGLSVREHALWRRGLRNELIGLIICITCGFILGLFTTFAETKWGSSTSFPTSEMKSRGDVKRLWVGVLIALPSGAGVALSVLGGNTGSLVGVAISGLLALFHNILFVLFNTSPLASLLPPAVNCGLLFAYALLGISFSNVAAVLSSSKNTNVQYSTILNCTKYINNDYQPLYKCNLAVEAAILAGCSLLLTIVNILCIIIMALIILRIKEVVPLHQPNKDITNFFHHDVKVARDYNKTIHEGDLDANNLSIATINRNHLTQSIVKRWKTFKSSTSRGDDKQHQETGQSLSINTNLELTDKKNTIDMESRRKRLRLKEFAKEYDLDVFDNRDYDLISWDSREKVRLLVSDLVDIYQDMPPVFVDLFRLQPCNTQTSTHKEDLSFYEEIIELLPPKWYELFAREQQQRQSTPWSSTFNRTYSLRLPRLTTVISESNENNSDQSSNKRHQKYKSHLQRQSSVPATSLYSSNVNQETEITVEGTRFRITKPLTTTKIVEDESVTI